MSKPEYPKLTRTQIVTVLGESHMATVSETDFINPSAEFVSSIYTSVLISLGFLQEKDEVEQSVNPLVSREAIRLLKLSNMVKKLMEGINCPINFTLKDLANPDSNRTEIFLGAILCFYLYKVSKLKVYVSAIDELKSIADQRREIEARAYQLNAEIENYNQAREKELPLVQELDAKVKELRQTVATRNIQQASLRGSIRKLKEKAEEMDDKISNAEILLEQSVQENTNLHSKIVQSDQLQRTLEVKKLAREVALNLESSAMQSFHDKSTTVELYAKVSKNLSMLLSQMLPIEEQVNYIKSVKEDLKILEDKVMDEEVLDKSLEAKAVELQVKVKQMDELLKQVQKQCDLEIEDARKELDDIKLEVESKRQYLQAKKRNVEIMLMEVEGIDSKTCSHKGSTRAIKMEIDNRSEEIVNEVRNYSDSIWSLMSKLDVDLETQSETDDQTDD